VLIISLYSSVTTDRRTRRRSQP